MLTAWRSTPLVGPGVHRRPWSDPRVPDPHRERLCYGWLHPLTDKPWSLEGGEEGSGNFIEVIKPEGKETYSFVSGLSVTTEDVIRVITSSGAGYGDPKQRSRDAVREDVKNGLVSEEDAREIYALND